MEDVAEGQPGVYVVRWPIVDDGLTITALRDEATTELGLLLTAAGYTATGPVVWETRDADPDRPEEGDGVVLVATVPIVAAAWAVNDRVEWIRSKEAAREKAARDAARAAIQSGAGGRFPRSMTDEMDREILDRLVQGKGGNTAQLASEFGCSAAYITRLARRHRVAS